MATHLVVLLIILNIFLLEEVSTIGGLGATCTYTEDCYSIYMCCQGVSECHLRCIGKPCRSHDNCGEPKVCCKDNICASNGGELICPKPDNAGIPTWAVAVITAASVLLMCVICRWVNSYLCGDSNRREPGNELDDIEWSDGGGSGGGGSCGGGDD